MPEGREGGSVPERGNSISKGPDLRTFNPGREGFPEEEKRPGEGQDLGTTMN